MNETVLFCQLVVEQQKLVERGCAGFIDSRSTSVGRILKDAINQHPSLRHLWQIKTDKTCKRPEHLRVSSQEVGVPYYERSSRAPRHATRELRKNLKELTLERWVVFSNLNIARVVQIVPKCNGLYRRVNYNVLSNPL